MWVLCLNDMRSSNIENLQPVCRANTKEELKAFVAKEKVTPYTTNGENIVHHTTDQMAGTTTITPSYTYHKSFRHGGPLEWFNQPYDHDEARHYVFAGTEDEWAAEARQNYRNKVLVIPTIPQ